MKKMWEEDKLKPEIYVKMVQITEGWFPVIHNYSHLIYLFGTSCAPPALLWPGLVRL
jgi:hypothetical protein